MGSPTPQEIVTSGRWSEALFTTYAVSLSFFEAHLLRSGLKKNGCRRIVIVVDADGYSQSLAERQALGTGLDYRLIQVGMPRGVFHPKCTYLHGDDGDVLIVGSGNLTFGGYGENIELVEVFHSRRSPEAFADFAVFLSALRQRPDFVNPDSEWIARFEKLAQAAANGSRNSSSVRLVHCVNQPIMDTLAELSREHGRPTALRILSPFYDADASAVRALVRSLDASRVIVGLLPGQEQNGAFPFDKMNEAHAATIDAPEPGRRLHAKLFEIEWNDGARATLSGSVNATRQSLCSINNVEIGVLRVEKAAPPRFIWQAAKKPTTAVGRTPSAAGLGARILLHAKLTEAGEIAGVLFSTHSVLGQWTGTITGNSASVVRVTLTVDADGRFTCRVPRFETLQYAGALQLEINQGDRRARGWIDNEWLLELSHMREVPTDAILRYFTGEATNEDDLSLFDFLSDSLDEFATMPAPRSDASGRPASVPDVDGIVIDVASLAPRDSASPSQVRKASHQGPETRLGRLIQRLFGHIEESIISGNAKRVDAKVQDTEVEDSEGDEEDDSETAEDARNVRIARKAWDALLRFREAVKHRLTAPLADGFARRLCNAWLLVELHYHLRAPEDTKGAEDFVREWLFAVASRISWQGIDVVDRRAVAAAALLAGNAIARGNETATVVALHEAMERLGVDLVRVSAVTPEAVFRRIHLPLAPDSKRSLAAVFAARTRRQEVLLVLSAIATRQPLPSDVALLETREGKRLKEETRGGRVPLTAVMPRGRTSCAGPRCYISLPTSVRAEIERLRLSRCVQCGTFLFNAESRP